jgi:hypothetical protein
LIGVAVVGAAAAWIQQNKQKLTQTLPILDSYLLVKLDVSCVSNVVVVPWVLSSFADLVGSI